MGLSAWAGERTRGQYPHPPHVRTPNSVGRAIDAWRRTCERCLSGGERSEGRASARRARSVPTCSSPNSVPAIEAIEVQAVDPSERATPERERVGAGERTAGDSTHMNDMSVTELAQLLTPLAPSGERRDARSERGRERVGAGERTGRGQYPHARRVQVLTPHYSVTPVVHDVTARAVSKPGEHTIPLRVPVDVLVKVVCRTWRRRATGGADRERRWGGDGGGPMRRRWWGRRCRGRR